MIPLKWHDAAPANVMYGTTVENQEYADRRIPHLLKVPGRRFLSIEPLLGPVDLLHAMSLLPNKNEWKAAHVRGQLIHWVIVGGESGTNARPMHPDWARSIRDQCVAAGVPFFFKQWGEWVSRVDRDGTDPEWRAPYTDAHKHPERFRILNLAGGFGFHGEGVHLMERVGKKKAGRLLDDMEWNQFPDLVNA
jgi:hypothetical protein